MKDRWNYSGLGQVEYGIQESYEQSCQWLDHPGWTVEDWGCGCAWARRYFRKANYIGIDGSQNDFADICRVDVSERDSRPEAILLRHVLEHNEGWKKLLENAIRCCTRRLVLVFFIPFGPETKIINRSTDPKYLGVVDIQFRLKDIQDALEGLHIIISNCGTDTILFCEKRR